MLGTVSNIDIQHLLQTSQQPRRQTIVPILQMRRLRPGPEPRVTELARGGARTQTRWPRSRFPSLSKTFLFLRLHFNAESLWGHSDDKTIQERVTLEQTGHPMS